MENIRSQSIYSCGNIGRKKTAGIVSLKRDSCIVWYGITIDIACIYGNLIFQISYIYSRYIEILCKYAEFLSNRRTRIDSDLACGSADICIVIISSFDAYWS